MATAFQADAFQTDALAFQIDVTAATVAANLPTGSGRKQKLPYGWWQEAAAPQQEIITAERAIKAAQAEVKSEPVAPQTVNRLRAALWFAEADTQILRLEQITRAQQADALRALERQVAQAKAKYLAEMEDEEEVELLLLSGI